MLSQSVLSEALHGARVEIPRADRRLVPLSAFVSQGRRPGAGLGERERGARGGPRRGVGGGGGGAAFPSPRDILPDDFAPGVPVVDKDAADEGASKVVCCVAAGVGDRLGVVSHRVVAVHVTAATGGGSATSELRAFGPFVGGFRIRSLAVIPLAGVQTGQFFDVRISGDGSTADVANPSGTSVFLPVLGSPPSPDDVARAAVPLEALRLSELAEVLVAQQFVKVLVSFRAPAVALPDVSFVFEVDELAAARSPVIPRVVPRGRAPRVASVVPAIAGAVVSEVVPEAVRAGVVALAVVLPHTAVPAAVVAGAASEVGYVPAVGYFEPIAAAAVRGYDPSSGGVAGAAAAPAPAWVHGAA